MLLFKKFIYYMMVIALILLVAYCFLYAYTFNNGFNYNPIKEYSKVLNFAFKDLYHSFAIEFVDAFSDTIIYVFTFHYSNISMNVKAFLVAIGLSSIPFLVTFFQFLTFRGFQAFRLKIKKAKANPFYYHDYIVANKDFGNDNIEDTDLSLLPILIPLRILVLIIILLLLPILLFVYSIFEFIGLMRGITRTGKTLDFE